MSQREPWSFLGGSLQLDFTLAFIIEGLDGQNKGAAHILFRVSSIGK